MNKLSLKTGIDIPFPEARISIHQPTIKQISLIMNDEDFFNLIDFLNFSKTKLNKQDRKGLESFSDFNIFMTMIQKEEDTMISMKNKLESLLYLLFPQSTGIALTPNSILIITEKEEQEEDKWHVIDENNFDAFKEIINNMFYMSRFEGQRVEYNPGNELAEQIAEKLKRGRERVAAQKKADGEEFDVLGKYASILSIGMQISLDTIFDYTVYQLFYSFERFEKKEAYDTYFQAQVAGATGMKAVKHWMM